MYNLGKGATPNNQERTIRAHKGDYSHLLGVYECLLAPLALLVGRLMGHTGDMCRLSGSLILAALEGCYSSFVAGGPLRSLEPGIQRIMGSSLNNVKEYGPLFTM